ncbi:MAG: pyruvate kinase [Planctomycetota bacterium]
MTRPRVNESRTKIVATVGPACQTVERLAELIEAGVDVFRINSAHGTRAEHEQTLVNIRAASEKCGFSVGVLLDLAGPKIRVGQLLEDPLQLDPGQEVMFVRGDVSSSAMQLTSSYKHLVDELAEGNRVLLADGTIALKVQRVTEEAAVCRVTAGGELRSRQGINLPGVGLSVSAMLPADIDNAVWGAQNGVDFVSLSFVRSASDVRSLKDLMSTYESSALVIAKIEKPDALDDLENIVDVADGIMVARGDLGVEIDVAETPVAQKRIIRVCKEKMKPVIVATQMLDSMHHSRRPTRAEATDVANAMLDGTDACMLSGETAIGDYPVEAVEMMSRIMSSAERELLQYQSSCVQPTNRVHEVTSAVTHSATEVAESIGAKLIVIATRSGGTAWVKSNTRSLIPTLAVSENPETLRRMNLFWGIKPIPFDRIDDSTLLIETICKWAEENELIQRGDHIVFVTGTGVMEKAHNVVLVHTVE